MATIRELLRGGEERLRGAGIEQPGREAALLLGHCLEMTEAALLAHDLDVPAGADAAHFHDLVGRRAAHAPAAYLLGTREFWGRRFRVDDRVLVPRPETEHLVEAALALDLADDARVLDVGTGSGCLAATLAAERPRWRVVASDRAVAALAVAGRNLALLRVHAGRIASDLASAIAPGSVDLVVSNPPYVAADELDALAPEVRDHEPRHALLAARDGLAIVERLLVETPRVLRPGGWLLCEIGERHGEAAGVAAASAGFEAIEVRPDLAGRDRVLAARRAA